jgi:hypothetical protein
MTIILTRYLYLKSGVLESLKNSILKNQFSESLFWAYEIYYSGFEEEIFDYTFEIIETYYKTYPKLSVYLNKKRKEWDKEKTENILGTIIQNICVRNHTLRERRCRQVYGIIRNQHIENLKTKQINHGWNILSQVCLFDGLKNTINSELLLHIFRNDWLFYACYSPIWKRRVMQHNGIINKKTVTFENDDDLDDFYNKYNYDPDEQSIEIQKRCLFI